MFKIGDVVVYSATGVCKISDICDKDFGGCVSQYYVLTPLLQKTSTVFVPLNNERLTRKMHYTLTKEEFEAVFAAARKREPVRPESESLRKEKFTEILVNGDRESLMMMVYDLGLFKTEQIESGKRLHLADERLLGFAKTLLYEELSYVFNITQDKVPAFLEEQFK